MKWIKVKHTEVDFKGPILNGEIPYFVDYK